jgi:hypothetical protein
VRRLFSALALLLAAGACFGLEFRNTTWLMSRDEVIASEPGKVVAESSLRGRQQVVYRALVNGFAATITYLLENDKLLSATCSFRKDADRRAFDAMKLDMIHRDGSPAFEHEDLVGWRLERTEIALAHLPDGTSYAAFWEKSYFARINNLTDAGNPPKF